MIRTVLLVCVTFAAGCWVDRRTPDYACDDDTDCAGMTPNRTCDKALGYCVPLACPPGCPQCDLAGKTCNRSCSSNSACNLTCPSGFTCAFTCNGNRACESIACGSGSCTVTCSGGSPNNEACGQVECGAGPCDVTCEDADSCGSVGCNDSCNCDVGCAVGQSCDALTCVDPSCRVTDGCSSSAAATCSRTCPAT